jgi:PAS domain S-box-containing protein
LAFGISAVRARRERNQAEHALRENERRLRSLFEDSPISIWEEDFSDVWRLIERARADGVGDWDEFFGPPERVREFASRVRVLDVNRATLSLLEYGEKKEIVGGFLRTLDDEAIAAFRAELIALASGRNHFEGESVRRTATGKPVFVQLRLVIVPGHEAGWSRIVVSLVDLSERRKAEQALQESEAKYRGLVEQSAEGIILLDGAGSILDCNPVLECLIGFSKRELLGRKIWDFDFRLLPEEIATEREFADFRKKWESELENCDGIARLGPYEAVVRNDVGGRRIIEQTFFPISSAAGLKIGGILRDVTERRAAEESLVASLREKELLLREVHHRVKNNLQIICSLIYFQQNKADASSPANLALMDMDARVRSMAIVHELLYKSDDFASIDFSTYVQQLCSYLTDAYLADRSRVRVVVAGDKIPLPIDKAIPCGLIINELVVNALKHAFPDGRSGTVQVEMTRGANGLVTMSVSDDGVGMTQRESAAGERKGIGLTLVENLADQLGGRCAGEYAGGVKARVVFPL